MLKSFYAKIIITVCLISLVIGLGIVATKNSSQPAASTENSPETAQGSPAAGADSSQETAKNVYDSAPGTTGETKSATTPVTSTDTNPAGSTATTSSNAASGTTESTSRSSTGKTQAGTAVVVKTPQTTVKKVPVSNPMVTFKLSNGGTVKVELYPSVAPNTVNNFISLVQRGFYNGLTFHRVIPGFMIQGGDPQGVGSGGPGYSIKGEFASNNFPNKLSHERGVISMARTNEPDSAGSQFFIMVAAAPHLNGDYAAFGKVVSGMDYVDKIVSVPTGPADKPLEPQSIKTATVDTFGVKYPAPVKVTQ